MGEDDDLVLKASGWDRLYVPPPEESKYAITGKESQVLTLSLLPSDSVQTEPGTMMYMTDGMKPSVSCEGCFGRCCGGEACYVVNYTNTLSTGTTGFVALTPTFPTAKVVPVDMSSGDVGGVLIAQQGAFMSGYGEVKLGVSFDFNCMRCCCAGTGMIRQKIEGSGVAFLAATGTIVQRVLKDGEVIVVDSNCVLAFAEKCHLDLKRAGGIMGMIGGGEGIFNTTLTGPGLVLIQSMNETMFHQALVAEKMYRR